MHATRAVSGAMYIHEVVLRGTPVTLLGVHLNEAPQWASQVQVTCRDDVHLRRAWHDAPMHTGTGRCTPHARKLQPRVGCRLRRLSEWRYN